MTGTASRLTGLQALAVARLVQAVVAILVLVQMIWTGLEPSAELEGVLVLIGAVLLVPVLPYAVTAVISALALDTSRPWASRLLCALGVVDLAVGALMLIAVTRSGTPLRSPLLVGLVPLMLGVATLVAWHRAYRTAG
ncbi:MAG: hypothetical protein JNL54_02680 [Kineosporiaceae bacterium]|nr:hypothetical protein [Kineosporiaceae bacterium]